MLGASIGLSPKPRPKPKAKHRVAPSPPEDFEFYHEASYVPSSPAPFSTGRKIGINLERTAQMLGLTRTASSPGLSPHGSSARHNMHLEGWNSSPGGYRTSPGFGPRGADAGQQQRRRRARRRMPHRAFVADVASSDEETMVDSSTKNLAPAANASAVEAADMERAEALLSESRLALAATQHIVERQRLEIATLKGRGTALKLAGEEATRLGRAWSQADVRRYHTVPRAENNRISFADDDLRELVDQAIVATDRRVRSAVSEAARCRVESEKAESDALAQLELDLASIVQTSEAEYQSRMATRALLARSNRTAAKLRAALLKLEEEASAAASVRASDIRSVAARLVAQREAIATTLTDTLHLAEEHGAHSVRGLSDELERVHAARAADVATRDAEIDRLRAALAAAKERLVSEQRSRTAEVGRLEGRIGSLRDEMASLAQRTVTEVNPLGAVQVGLLQSELRAEEGARRDVITSLQAQIGEIVEERARAKAAWDAKLQATLGDGMVTRDRLHEQIKAVEAERATAVAKLKARLSRESEAHAHEAAMLRARLERLTAEVTQLRANSTSGRRRLYWASMKKARNAKGDVVVPVGDAPPDDVAAQERAVREYASQYPSPYD